MNRTIKFEENNLTGNTERTSHSSKLKTLTIP